MKQNNKNNHIVNYPLLLIEQFIYYLIILLRADTDRVTIRDSICIESTNWCDQLNEEQGKYAKDYRNRNLNRTGKILHRLVELCFIMS